MVHLFKGRYTSLDTKVAAQLDDSFEQKADEFISRRQRKAMTMMTRAGMAAGHMAVNDSQLNFKDVDPLRSAAIWGVIGNSHEDKERDFPDLNIVLKDMPSECSSVLSVDYGIQGMCMNLSCACASSAYALANAAILIENGIYDVIIVGGIGNMVTNKYIKGFNQLMAMTINEDPDTACRPFTKNRDGFVLGEGAGSIILESEDFAKKRGAHIYCTLSGYAMTSEASDLVAPIRDGSGMAKTMELAINKAGCGIDAIDYINAHGTSTILNDSCETYAIKKVFGSLAKKIPVSSTKSMIGHTMAACGVIEAIICIKALEEQIIPPTINYDIPDEELDLDYVPNLSRKARIRTALSNSFGFGGQNCTLIFQK